MLNIKQIYRDIYDAGETASAKKMEQNCMDGSLFAMLVLRSENAVFHMLFWTPDISINND